MSNNIELSRIEFIDKAMKQLLYKFGLSKEKPENFNELTLAVLLHITAYQYDNREPLNLTEEEKKKIIDKCILRPGDSRTNNSIDPVTNLRVGTIRTSRATARELNRLHEYSSRSDEDYYTWGRSFAAVVLGNTRNAVAHGFFELDNIDRIDVVRIQNSRNNFATTYELDCLIDSCKDISDPKVKETYNVLLNSLRNPDEFEKIYDLKEEKNKLMFYDLLVNILINYNEAKVCDSATNYRRAVKNLYLESFPELIEVVTHQDKVRKVRDSATHHYRKIDPHNSEKILIVDYRNKDDEIPDFEYPLEFKEISNFAKAFSIKDVIAEKQRLDQPVEDRFGRSSSMSDDMDNR